MSWSDRLQQLNLPNDICAHSVTETVFVDGPTSIVRVILLELAACYNWIVLSNITVDRLLIYYKNDWHKTYNYLLSQRNDDVIYEMSQPIVQLSVQALCENIMSPCHLKGATFEQLMLVFTGYCNTITKYDLSKIVLILDCRLSTLNNWCNQCDVTPTNTCSTCVALDRQLMYLALLNRRHHLPMLKAIIICDLMADGSIALCRETESVYIQYIYRLLHKHVNRRDDIVLANINVEVIKANIIDNHRCLVTNYDFM
jgi:hypothetical protein